jgi:hypothetical protein
MHAWMRSVLIAALSLSVLSCTNILSSVANKNTDEAIVFDAQQDMNSLSYTAAITKLLSLSASYQTRRDVQGLLAAAYAGRCGLNLLTFAQSIASLGATTPMVDFLSQMSVSSAAKEVDCETAETILTTLGSTPATRTADENVLLAFIDFAKIGSILSQYADVNHDGAPDPAFDPCNVALLPDAEARQIATGLTIAIGSLQGLSIASGITASVTGYCTSLKNLPGMIDPCSKTTTAAFTVSEIKAINGLVKTNFFGVGSCADATLATCVCP